MLKGGNQGPETEAFGAAVAQIQQELREAAQELGTLHQNQGAPPPPSPWWHLEPNPTVHEIQYPIAQIPPKISSHNLDKNITFKGSILGIKGQYIITESACLNVRKHEGYMVDISVSAGPDAPQ